MREWVFFFILSRSFYYLALELDIRWSWSANKPILCNNGGHLQIPPVIMPRQLIMDMVGWLLVEFHEDLGDMRMFMFQLTLHTKY